MEQTRFSLIFEQLSSPENNDPRDAEVMKAAESLRGDVEAVAEMQRVVNSIKETRPVYFTTC